MPINVPIWFVLALGVSAPDLPPQNAEARPTVRTVRKSPDGTVRTEERAIDPNALSVTTFMTPDGQTIERTVLREQRVLIELRARPLRDRIAPGATADLAEQRDQLHTDLMAIDQRLGSSSPSQITYEFSTLFSGVAATVSAAAVAEIRRLPYVASVYPDVRVRASLAQSVPLIGATSVRTTYGVNGSGVKVAIIDTGIDYKHADLGGCFGTGCKVVGGYDFVNDDGDPLDDNGHGTHVAGIVAASGAVKGVAPGATLLAYKVLNSWGYGDASDIIAAIERAVLDGAQIANLSLGGGGTPGDPMSQAVDNATAAGLLSVVSAGNNGYGYRTIDSPGTALTALTVGSSTKSGEMSYFSGRGYVMASDELVMKPEVVAPGEEIRSTVTTAGFNGNPTGYAAMSGTSMAAPHVAGAAALLLQSKPGLSASEIKSRLAATAQPLGQNIFIEGAGRVDLVAAFGATITVSSTHVPLGIAAGTSGTVTFEKSVTIRNTAAGARTVTLSEPSPSPLPEGTTLEITPTSVSLQGGSSAVVTLRATIDTALTGTPNVPLNWTTRLRVTDETRTVSVPVYFFRGSMLTVHFDGSPTTVITIAADTGRAMMDDIHSSPFRTLVPSGPVDVILEYNEPQDLTIVVREQQDLTDHRSLTIHKSEATRTITTKNVDDAQNPLPEDRSYTTFTFGPRGVQNPAGVTFGMSVGTLDHTIRISPLSSRYAAAAVFHASFSARHFMSSWRGAGLSSDVQLPLPGAPYRALTRTALRPPGAAEAGISISAAVGVAFAGGGGVGGNGHSVSRELSPTILFQSAPSPDANFPIANSAAFGFSGRAADKSTTDVLNGGHLLHDGGDELKFDRYGFFFPSEQPLAVLGASVTRWDVDQPPNYFSGQFSSWGDRISAYDPEWRTQTLSVVQMVAGKKPELTLYRNGTLVGTYAISSWSGVRSLPGQHEIRSTSNYTLGGINGASHVVVSFDTTPGDTNPPALRDLRIERSNGASGTSTAPDGTRSHAAVSFSVFDDNLTTVTLEWRQNGTTAWTPLTLNTDGSGYGALVPLETDIDLRLTATDARGNRFREEWIPAAIAQPARPPDAPSFVQATRSGEAAVTVTWRAPMSDVDIAEYRIERVPGGVVATTPESRFVDTNVQTGDAYAYRVIAIDQNGRESEPSSYDLATLIEFQDDPIVPRTTRIRRVHLTELRAAVNAVLKAAGLGPLSWDDDDDVVRGSDFSRLQYAIDDARDALGMRPLIFQWLFTYKPIAASDIQELRDAVR